MNKRIAFSNFIWRFAERCSAQGVSIMVSIILARMLAPEIYGTVALITVIISILQVFIDGGLGAALIQKKDADDLDFSTVFYFNFVMCIVLYVGMFWVAPDIARFYNHESLISLIRVTSLTLIMSGIKNIQQAYVSRRLQFKRFFYSTLGGTIFSAVLGITLAYTGCGIWALVAQQLSNTFIDTLILWLTVKWRPKRMFSIRRLKKLLAYGWKLLVSNLINAVYNNIGQLIIGKKYSTSDLAYYNKGDQFPNVVITNVNITIDSVLLPLMATEQENLEKIKNMTRRSIKTSVYIMAPLLIGLAVTAPSVVSLIFTDKWLPCVPFMRAFCIIYIFQPVHTANLNAIKAVGRSDLFLKLEIIKKLLGIIILLSVIKYGVMAIACGEIIVSIFAQMINAWPNKKLLNYSYTSQIKDILPTIVLGAVMGIIVNQFNRMSYSAITVLIIQIIVGALFYIIGSVITKNDSFIYLWKIIKRK